MGHKRQHQNANIKCNDHTPEATLIHAQNAANIGLCLKGRGFLWLQLETTGDLSQNKGYEFVVLRC